VLTCQMCGDEFVVHRHCYRGHVYCGQSCQAAGRRKTARASHRHHRQSVEGRRDHRDAERLRRERRRVGDHCSKNSTGRAEMAGTEGVSNVSEYSDTSSCHAAAAPTGRVERLPGRPMGYHVRAESAEVPSDRGALHRQRLVSGACIVCGSRHGLLVRTTSSRARGVPRAPPHRWYRDAAGRHKRNDP
jgi:hypothetical protein